jgi:hypothetical protein
MGGDRMAFSEEERDRLKELHDAPQRRTRFVRPS